MAKAKAKTVAIVAVPQNRAEANDAIFEIGDLDRRIAEMDIALKDELARVKAAHELAAAPLAERKQQLTDGLCAFAEAHRAELTQGGKTKTVAFPAGEISWMQQRPSIGPIRSMETVIAWLKAHGYERFVRVSEEVNRLAMLEEPDEAVKVPGVRIGGGHEVFAVKPFTPKGLEAAS